MARTRGLEGLWKAPGLDEDVLHCLEELQSIQRGQVSSPAGSEPEAFERFRREGPDLDDKVTRAIVVVQDAIGRIVSIPVGTATAVQAVVSGPSTRARSTRLGLYLNASAEARDALHPSILGTNHKRVAAR